MSKEQGQANDRKGIEKPPQTVKAYFEKHGRLVPVSRVGLFLLEGSASSEVFFIEKGTAQVARFSANGKQSILREMGPGEIFGEMAAIDGQPRSASVSIQSGDCVLRQIDAARFRQLLIDHPEVGLWLARHLAERIRDLTDRTVELATMSVGSRLQSQLLRLCERDGIIDDTAVIEPLPTHSELAAMIGTHREAVTRELGQLTRENIIAQSNRSMTVNSVTRLSQMLANTSGAAR